MNKEGGERENERRERERRERNAKYVAEREKGTDKEQTLMAGSLAECDEGDDINT